MAYRIESRKTFVLAQGLRRRTRTALRKACTLVAVLMVVGMATAVPVAAQSLQISGQSFPLTQVGQSVTQTVTLTVNAPDGLVFYAPQIAPEYSEYTLGADLSGCPIGLFSPLGTVCTFSVTFAPQFPGQANSPVPIGRSAPLQVGYLDADLQSDVFVNFALTGTGTGAKGVLSPGLISDIVGDDTMLTYSYGGDGSAASGAIFNVPAAIAMDVLGNIYIADTQNCGIRVVYKGGAQLANLIALENAGTTAVAGDIYTIAGITNPSVSCGWGQDGVLATQSPLSNPGGIALDAAGNLYISDTFNQTVRMVSATTGIINTVAGTLNSPSGPVNGFSGDGGPATSAQLNYPAGITVDGNGNIFIADTYNMAIRVVYQGGAQLAGLIALENAGTTATVGNIYTLAGGPNNTYLVNNGDGGQAIWANLIAYAVTVDSIGDVYIADGTANGYNGGIRRVDAVSGIITTLPANGGSPRGVAVDASDNVYYVSQSTCQVLQYNPISTYSAVVAGNGSCSASGDSGAATQAGISIPTGVVADGAGNLYILEADGVRFVDGSQTSLAFGSVNIGDTSAVQTAIVSNNDIINLTTPLTPFFSSSVSLQPGSSSAVAAPFATVPFSGSGYGTVLDCNDSSFAPLALDPGQSCGISVVFQPVADGPFTATASYYDSKTIQLSGAGAGALPTAVLSGGPLSFTAAPNGAPSAAQNLILSASGANLTITGISVSDPSFSQTNNCPSLLAAGSSCTISITYAAASTTLVNANLTVTDNASSGSGTQAAALSGIGAWPTATLTGGPLSFTAVVNEGSGAAQNLTLTNTSNVELTITGIYASVFNFRESDNCGTLLAANSSCTISVTYFASTTALVNATFTVADNASSGGGTQTASLSGTGTAPVATLSISSINFGTVPGGTSATSTVTLDNTGTAPLTFCTVTTCFSNTGIYPSAFSVSGNEPTRFAVDASACGATLAINASCNINVTFTPSTSGVFSATLNVNDDSGGGLGGRFSTQTVQLSGGGYTPLGTSSFTVGNTVFPSTAVGQSTTQTVTVQLNNNLILKSIGIQSGFTEYSTGAISGCIVDGTTQNPSGTTCSIQITFTPWAPGSARTAPLVVTTTENGGAPYAFGLTGTGTGPVAALTPGIISNYVGGSGGVCAGIAGEDGTLASNAYVGFLNGMALDSAGNLYLSDSMNFVIWRVDPSGYIHLFAGNPFHCGGYDQYLNGNGSPALGANIERGGPLAVDNAGGLYIGDNAANSMPSIRYINSATKIITSVLGNLDSQGNQGNGWESNTYFYPGSIIQETLPVANTGGSGTHNVNFLFQVVQGGTSGGVAPSFPNAAGGTVTDGGVLWQNEGPGTTAGVGCPNQTDAFGDGCTGTNATLYGVTGMALDQGGNLYFSDSYKLVSIGNGSEQAVYNAVVRRMDAKTGIVTIYAGTGITGHSGDGGPATSAKIFPGDLAFDSNGNLYINEGTQVRMVNAATGIITTVVGSGAASGYRQDTCYGDVGDGGPALSAGFGVVSGMALDAANNLYLVDNGACDVRRVDAGTQQITTIAGNSSAYGYDTGDINNIYGNWNGSAYAASLAQPLLARVDGMGNIYVMQMSRGVRKINVSQSVMSFPGQQIDTSSLPLTTTVLNAGNSGWVKFQTPFTTPPWGISNSNWTRDVSNPTGSNDCYNVGAIDIGYECPVNVDFTPLVNGALTGTNVVTDNAANTPQTITLTGTASGTAPSVTLLPFLLSFSTPQDDSSVPQTLTLSNNDSNPLPISSISIIESGTVVFTQTNNCGTVLAANSSCIISVTFSPPVVGGHSDNAPPPDIFTAQVSVSDAAGNSPQTAMLTGIGTLPAAPQIVTLSITETLHLTDTPALVESTPLNIVENIHTSDDLTSLNESLRLAIDETIRVTDADTTVPVKVTPTITWPAPGAITYGTALSATQLNATASVPGTFSYSPPSGTVVPEGNDQLSVTFAPSNPAAYTTASASVTINVTAPTGQVTLNKSSLTFAPLTVGLGSSSQMVTLYNNSGSPITVTPSITGDFVVSANTCTGTIAAGGTQCNIWVRFTPQSVAALSGTLSINANSGPVGTVGLSGTGIAGPITLNKSAMVFAPLTVGLGSSSQMVTLYNNSGSPITVTPSITGDFVVSANTCTGTIAAGGTQCNIWVRFTPQSVAALSGTLTINANSGPVGTVGLTGTGQ